MNSTIELLLQHRSYRHFDSDYVIPASEVNLILQAAKQAPSWMNGQHYSIIRITDPALREKIGSLSPRNPHILSASEFWIVLMDEYRSHLCSDAYDGTFSAMGMEDTLLTATADAAFAAQNALIAAESLGYGTCYIGGMRLIAEELIALLNLPKYVFPLYGLCIGKAAIDMAVKPRLPMDATVFENQYQTDKQPEIMAHYEQVMLDFAEARETLPWREKLARYYSLPYGEKTPKLLREQGFLTAENHDK